MTKSICTMARREDLTRSEFHTYYESNHAVLGAKHFPFTKYVRNHVIDAPDLWYDTISEFWADDIEAAAALMNGPVGDILRVDERKFCDQSKIGPAGSDEVVLSEGEATDRDGVRVAHLFARDGAEPEAFRAAVLELAKNVAKMHTGVSVDFLQSWRDVPFPADAVVWSPSLIVENAPSGVRLAQTLRVRRVETPASALKGAKKV